MAGGAFVAGSIVSKFMMDKSQWDASIKAVQTSVATLEAKAATAGKTISAMGSKMEGAGRKLSMLSLPILAIGGACAKMAIDANESENLFSVAMGDMAGTARTWSIEISKSLGLNQYEVRKMVGTFNVMLASMGMSKEGAYDMSKGLTVLANDMASLYNLPVEEAFTKLQSGISGEIEPLKRLGIIVNETTIKQWALTHGVIKQGQELTEAQKIQARYNVIMAATKAAQGDLGRTINQTANQMRALKSKASEAAITFGTMMIPMVDKVISGLKKAVDWFNGLSEKTKKTIMNVGLFVAAAGPLLLILGKIFSVTGLVVTGFSKMIGIFGGLFGQLKTSGGLMYNLQYQMLKLKSGVGESGGVLKNLGPIAIAAFAGWQIGKIIGDILGLNKHIEGLATKLINLLGIAKSTAEAGEAHATAAATRQEWAAMAFKATGKEAQTLKDIIELMEPTYVKMGTTGSAQLDAILKAHVASTAGVAGQTAALKDSADVYGAVEIAAGETKAAVETFAEYLKTQGIMTVEQKAAKVKELEGRLKDLGKAFKAGKIDLEDYVPESERLTEEIKKLKEGYRTALPPARDMNDAWEAAGKIVWKDHQLTAPYSETLKKLGIKTIPELRNETRILLQYQMMVSAAFKAGAITGEQYKAEMASLQEQIRNVGQTASTELPAAASTVSNAFQEMYLDIAQSMADVFIDTLGLTEALIGESTKHNEEYYAKCYEELQADYEARKAAIEENITDEEARKAALLELDEWYAAETERIRQDEETSKDEHAANEEKRQNSLWTKVKGIFGEAVETMLKTWLTKFIGGILTSIFEKVVPAMGSAAGAVTGVGTAASTAATTVGGVLTGLATTVATIIGTLIGAIAGAIVALAAAIGTAIVTLATSIAAAATALAAAAPALLTVGAVAIALYAGFQAVNALLSSGGGGAGDGMGRVVERQDIFLAAWGWWHIDVKDILFEELAKSDHRADQLDNIAGCINVWGANIYNGILAIASALSAVPGAATGAIVKSPMLVRVGEDAPRLPEIISPMDKIGDFARAVEGPADRGAGEKTQLNATLQAEFEPVLIDKGDKWMLGWIQKNLDHGGLKVPLTAVSGG